MSKPVKNAKAGPRAGPKRKLVSKKADSSKAGPERVSPKKVSPKRKAATRKAVAKLAGSGKGRGAKQPIPVEVSSEMRRGATAAVLDRLFGTVILRRDADPNLSHSARLLSRGRLKVAQKFGEEAVECLIEAVAGNSDKLISESADLLYHLIVMWVDAGLHPDQVWAELQRREGVSGIAEKASRAARRLEDGLPETK